MEELVKNIEVIWQQLLRDESKQNVIAVAKPVQEPVLEMSHEQEQELQSGYV